MDELFIKEVKTVCVQARIKSISNIEETDEPPVKRRKTETKLEPQVTIMLENLNRNTTIEVFMRVFKNFSMLNNEEIATTSLVLQRLLHQDMSESEDDEMLKLLDQMFLFVLKLARVTPDNIRIEVMYGFPTVK
jgi:hypothetical protein